MDNNQINNSNEQNHEQQVGEFKPFAKKWQDKWKEANIFKVETNPAKKKFYCLEMYPYPSASSMHMGHVRNYTIGDVYARYKRAQGFNVLYPMGYDAFGLPAENAAIKQNIHPLEYTESAIKEIKRQQQELGLSYDWSRELASCYPNYYRWNQWFFLQFMKKGLAYRKEAPVNWCPKCSTVLANEQVHDGKCWRCDNTIEIKPLKQWFLKITEYADRLLEDLTLLDGKWSDKIISMQKNWIGRSEGTQINFTIEETNEIIPIFTTRIDTIYGVTFIVYAPEHPKIMELVTGTEYEKPVKEFITKVMHEDKFSRTAEDKEKEGMFIGKYAINPVTNEKVPIYIGNFVLLEYGAGAVMAVPAHDQRDFEFAKKYNIPIKVVINPDGFELNSEKMSRAFVDDGRLINSAEFDGWNNRMVIEEIQKYLETNNIGKKIIQYKLRDWLISRQRYWGTPIPVIYCDTCGMQPVTESDLPILLPTDIEFGKEGSPLKTSKTFLSCTCPKCKGAATRETDTMDGFMDSCWYFLRFCSPTEMDKPFDPKDIKYWMPVDQYIGGAEHAVMHLLYARFFTKVLKDEGIVDIDEPFERLFNQGIVYKDGAKMSKSKGNIVTQEEISNKYGIDTARIFLMFVASPEKLIEWSDDGIEGAYKFLKRIYTLKDKPLTNEIDALSQSRMHKTIKEVTQYIENFEYNKAIVSMMMFSSYLQEKETIPKECLKNLIVLVSPFTPHLAEEIWETIGEKEFVAKTSWPVFDETKIDEDAEFLMTMAKQTKEDIAAVLTLTKIATPKKITIIVSQAWKYVFFEKVKECIATTHNVGDIIKKTLIAGHEKDCSALVPKLIKDRSKIPSRILSAEQELRALKTIQKEIESQYTTTCAIHHADEINHPKAGMAIPGKPSIIVE